MCKGTHLRNLLHTLVLVLLVTAVIKIILSGKNDGFCPNVTFEDNEFKDNKSLNDQGYIFIYFKSHQTNIYVLLMVRHFCREKPLECEGEENPAGMGSS